MSDKTGIEWTDATWTPLRARVKPDAGRIAAEKGYGKKAAGRILDGRTWDEMPEVSRSCAF